MKALTTLENVRDGTRGTFMLPKNYIIPPILAEATPDDFATALNITAQVMATRNKLCLEEYSASILKDITQQHEQTMERMKADYVKELSKLESDYKAHLYRLEHGSLDKEIQFKKEIGELEILLSKANASKDTLQKQFSDETERRVAHQVAQQKASDFEMINLLKEELERYRIEHKEMEAKLQARLSIQNNSSKRGQEGEETFQQILKDRMGWHLNYTGDKGHSADYSMNLHEIQIRFEVKDYSSTVPGKEVEKLRRDMREHPETDVGVFVSLNTAITSIPSISIEWTTTNQLLVYIPVFLQQDIDIVLHFLDLIFKTVKPYRAILCESSFDEQYPVLKDRNERAMLYARNGLARITKCMSDFTQQVKALQEKMNDLIGTTKANLSSQRDELESIIALLSGKDMIVSREKGKDPLDLPLVHEEKKKTKAKKRDPNEMHIE